VSARWRPRFVVGVVVLIGAAALVATAAASFSSSDSAAHTISTATLVAPTGLSAVNGTCSALSSTQVNLSWTATASAAADGYEVFRATVSGGPYSSLGTVNGAGTTTFTDTTPAFSTTYYYVVQSKRNSWRSPHSNQASVTTPSVLCVA
jgi:hypothetical protein